MLVSVIFILAILNKKLLVRVGAGVTAAALAVLIIEPLYNIVEIYFRLESVATGRDFILESVWNVIKSDFWLGHGPAGTKQVMYSHLPFMLGSPEEHFIYVHWSIIDFGHAHNFYLFFLSDMGLLGFLVSLLLPIIFISMGIRIIRKTKPADNFYYFLVIGIIGAGISLFIRGLFEWSNLISYGTLANDLPFWTIFVMLMFINKIDFSSNFRRVF
jgi:O-antigen ligase